MEENIKATITRVAAREYVFALLFAKAFSPDEEADAFYAREMENAEIEFGDQIDYVHDVFFGIMDTLADIDAKISAAASGWALNRLSKSTLSIMRLCIYEMTAVADVPKRVALNEAVELAKKFDDDNAPAFINGVLNTISHTLPERDCDK